MPRATVRRATTTTTATLSPYDYTPTTPSSMNSSSRGGVRSSVRRGSNSSTGSMQNVVSNPEVVMKCAWQLRQSVFVGLAFGMTLLLWSQSGLLQQSLEAQEISRQQHKEAVERIQQERKEQFQRAAMAQYNLDTGNTNTNDAAAAATPALKGTSNQFLQLNNNIDDNNNNINNIKSGNNNILQPPVPAKVQAQAQAQPPPQNYFSSASTILETMDCSQLTPCASMHTPSKRTSCYLLHPLLLWKSPFFQEFASAMHHQRKKRPQICYEVELLTMTAYGSAAVDLHNQPLPQPPAACAAHLPDTITYLHNFKAGGNTVLHTLAQQHIPYYHLASSDHAVFTQYQIHPGEYERDAKIMKKRAKEAIVQLHNQQDAVPRKHLAFTFFRSPIERFLSGVAQIEDMKIEWEVPKDSRYCYHIDNQMFRMKCIVDDITKNGVFYNIHLYPQSYLLDSWTNHGHVDLNIIALNMLQDLDPVLEALAPKVIRQRESAFEGRKKLKADQLPDSLKEDICKLYKMDVILMQLLNLDHDHLCPDFLTPHIQKTGIDPRKGIPQWKVQ